MRRCLSAYMLVLVVGLPACVTSETLTYVYSATAMEPYARSGTAVVKGQAFLKKRGGHVVVRAGEPVLLMPNVGVFAEAHRKRKQGIYVRVDESESGRVTDAGLADPVAGKAIRSVICDAQGNFEFTGLPAGEWLLYTRVLWEDDEYSTQKGSELIEVVTTASSGEQRVLLANRNRI